MTEFYRKKRFVFRVFYHWIFICLIVITICGCSSCRDKRVSLTKKKDIPVSPTSMLAHSDDIIELIRTVVIKQDQVLSDEDQTIILKSTPKIGQYVMADTFGQYFWIWNLSRGRTVRVSYIGDIAPQIDTNDIRIFFTNRNEK